MNKIITIGLIIIALITLLLLAAKGVGSPVTSKNITQTLRAVGGPFESSGSASRYALTEAIVEDGTLFLNKKRAKFATPDVTEYNGKYFSVFTPGVSFLGVPFYFLGKMVGLPQLVTYLSTGILSLLNVFLVAKLARKLGSGLYSSLLTGFIFLFATNALSYTLTFTQHHASSTLILLAIFNAFGERTWLKNTWLGILIGVALLVDIPNGVMMTPIAIWVIYKHFRKRQIKSKVNISLKLNIVGLAIGLMPFLALFGWYNYYLTGSYTKLAQTIGRTHDFDSTVDAKVSEKDIQRSNEPIFRLPYNSRSQLKGLYILLISNERGLVYYSPVVLLGMLGLFLLYKSKDKSDATPVLGGVVLMSIVSYSMFGDPWGGWAFGPRYLIPTAAILSASIGLSLQRFKKNIAFLILFIILSAYSIGVNVVGAMTTTQVPPKVEALNLADPIPYTYEYNWQLMSQGKNSSLAYNLFLSDKVESWQFTYLYSLIALLMVAGLYTASIFEKKTGDKI